MTEILARVREGDEAALEQLLPLVYQELRRLARNYMKREREGHTLQPTALTHEAYLRLVAQAAPQWECRAHFLAAAAQAMRRILVEHARARNRRKRGGRLRRTSLGDLQASTPLDPVDLLGLDQALKRLESRDPRKARVVELLYFGGLRSVEAALVLGVTSRTVERDFQYARLWLLRELTREADPA